MAMRLLMCVLAVFVAVVAGRSHRHEANGARHGIVQNRGPLQHSSAAAHGPRRLAHRDLEQLVADKTITSASENSWLPSYWAWPTPDADDNSDVVHTRPPARFALEEEARNARDQQSTGARGVDRDTATRGNGYDIFSASESDSQESGDSVLSEADEIIDRFLQSAHTAEHHHEEQAGAEPDVDDQLDPKAEFHAANSPDEDLLRRDADLAGDVEVAIAEITGIDNSLLLLHDARRHRHQSRPHISPHAPLSSGSLIITKGVDTADIGLTQIELHGADHAVAVPPASHPGHVGDAAVAGKDRTSTGYIGLLPNSAQDRASPPAPLHAATATDAYDDLFPPPSTAAWDLERDLVAIKSVARDVRTGARGAGSGCTAKGHQRGEVVALPPAARTRQPRAEAHRQPNAHATRVETAQSALGSGSNHSAGVQEATWHRAAPGHPERQPSGTAGRGEMTEYWNTDGRRNTAEALMRRSAREAGRGHRHQKAPAVSSRASQPEGAANTTELDQARGVAAKGVREKPQAPGESEAPVPAETSAVSGDAVHVRTSTPMLTSTLQVQPTTPAASVAANLHDDSDHEAHSALFEALFE